jgi:acetyl esterase
VPLCPEAEAVMTAMARAYPDIGGAATDVDEIRAAVAAIPPVDAPVTEVGSVEERSIPLADGRSAAARVYRPPAAAAPSVVAFFHGGGWVLGSVDGHDPGCRDLCALTGAIVVSVEYERAPESPFPRMPEDAYAATRWVAEHAATLGGDAERVWVAGDSAGGNLAAAVALMARDRGGPDLRLQLLVYPVTDAGFDTPSYREYGDGYFLTERRMRWYWDRYAPAVDDRANPYAAPLRTRDLSGLPPALVVTAECDPLRDEGEAYAARLAEAGTPATLRRFEGTFHGFFMLGHVLRCARAANQEVYAAVRAALEA